MPWSRGERATLWYHKWIEPVTEALYLRNLQQARQLAYAGRTAITRGEIPAGEEAEKAAYLLDYMEYHISKVMDPVIALTECEEFETRLSRPATAPMARDLSRRLLLQFRCSAERIGYRELEAPEFLQLYANVPERERNDEFWHFASTWAFHHFHSGILQRAYEEYAVNKGRFMSDWLWWRVRLMYLLSANQATETDVGHLLNNVTITEHMGDFEHTFKPALLRAGLFTPLVEELMELRRLSVAEATPEDIKREVAE